MIVFEKGFYVQDGSLINLENNDSPTPGQLIFGKDPSNNARPINVVGANNDELKTKSLDTSNLLNRILIELSKINIHLSLITDEEIKDRETSIKV